MEKENIINLITKVLLSIGGILLFVWGLLDVNILEKILVNFPFFEDLIYIAIGASAIYVIGKMVRK